MVVAWPSEDLQTLPACPALVLIYSRPSHGTVTEPLAIKEARRLVQIPVESSGWFKWGQP